MGFPLSTGNKARVVCIPVIHPKQITADVQETVHKVRPGLKGRVIKVVGVPGIHGGSTPMTDLDLIPYINTTALTAAIPAVNSSTAASTDAVLSPTITGANAIDVDDYISVDYDVTGGSTPTADGCGVLFYIALE